MANPEQALWRAVIAQAIADASGKSDCTTFERRTAHDWLLRSNGNFNRACALADLDPDYTRKLAQQRIEQRADKAAVKSAKATEKSATATPKASSTRLRKGQLYEFGGKRLTILQWAKEIGCTYPVLYYRISNGWPIERALTTPFRKMTRNTECQPAP
ncbi:hypothetical protein XH83_15415 [Bradyrhizobium sp. CCBAU 53351]|uniref:hypothetical protein n=1 Tax=Bradyrhizobium sp. CCBAU 53351 TaxID=1325114 RepID=UPI001888E272|nr:hypothetical protein [Bradyrhizobium sp. CCBAU 53351]QOZ76718.1 hypothetical protein XH83_15415 [Bradyrhizobium sp. CCBAU 53351]